MFKDFELFSSQYTEFIDPEKTTIGTCFRCNKQNFKSPTSYAIIVENDNDSEFTVKTKNAPFFNELIEYQ